MNRNDLIARKDGVRREIMQVRREINGLKMNQGGQSYKRQKKKVRALEDKLETLMGQESELRQQIDRTAPETAES